MLTEVEKAYFAGLFDGEGCVRSNHSEKKRTSYAVQLSIEMTDPGPIYKLYKEYGGSWMKRKRSNRNYIMYGWAIGTLGFDAFAQDILPYVQIKKRQLEIAIQMRALMKQKKVKQVRVSEEERLVRLDLHTRLKKEKTIKEAV